MNSRVHHTGLTWLAAPVLVALAYFCAAKLGVALAFPAAPVSALWAPNAIVMAALLLAPRRHWWVYLVAVLCAHLAVQLPNFPFSRVVIQYLANAALAVFGALAIRALNPAPLAFDRARSAFTLILFGGLLVPAATSLAMAGAFMAFGISSEFWLTVVARTITNAFAVVTLVPLIVHAVTRWDQRRATLKMARLVEATTLAVALAGVCVVVFAVPLGSPHSTPPLVYAPLPLLAWASMRFGIPGACSASLLVGAISTLGMLDGFGPFAGLDPVENALSVVTFHVVMCVSFVTFAALLEEWRHAGNALHVSEQRFRSILENNIIPTAIWHDDLRITEANDAFLQLTGCSGTDIEGGKLKFGELAAWSGTPALSGAGGEAFFGDIENVESELALRDGRRVPVILGHARFPSGEGGVIYALDLSAFRRAEARSERAENLHSAVLASLHDQVAVLDSAGNVIEVNDSWRRALEAANAKAFGLAPAGENLVMSCMRAADLGDRDAADQLRALRAVLDESQTHCLLEYREVSGDEPRWIEVSIERLRRREGGLVVTRTDVTARKRAEVEARNQRQQLTHLGRAAVLGQLSGAFAHELNQPLTSILGNAEAALSMMASGSDTPAELAEILRDIVHDDERAAQVLQRLRALLGKGDLVRKPMDLNLTLREVIDLTRSELITRNVALNLDNDNELPLVIADRIQVQQVVLNLVMNACEAMAGIPVAERKICLASRYLPNELAAEITVRDFGCGIAPGDDERIFQPFVTTKTHGLGLGLAICRSVAESHHGRLWAENVERGAMFHLKIPIEGGLP